MGSPQAHTPVLLIMAAFSRYPEALAWGRARTEENFGPVALASDAFDFHETAFYNAEMGAGLKKTFWAFERHIDPIQLPEIKLATNQWELDYAQTAAHVESRPLNLDPGYLTEAKLVLATTKDRDHRLYLGQGIYAEVTLRYSHGQWQPREWTYPDYRRAEYHAFFNLCRAYYRERRRVTSEE